MEFCRDLFDPHGCIERGCAWSGSTCEPPFAVGHDGRGLGGRLFSSSGVVGQGEVVTDAFGGGGGGHGNVVTSRGLGVGGRLVSLGSGGGQGEVVTDAFGGGGHHGHEQFLTGASEELIGYVAGRVVYLVGSALAGIASKKLGEFCIWLAHRVQRKHQEPTDGDMLL